LDVKKFLPVAVAAAVLLLAGTASADPHTSCESKPVKMTYSRLYYAVAKRHGTRTPGRNIRRHGLTDHKKSRCRDLRRSNRTFRRWLAPPPAPVAHSDVAPTSSTSAPVSTGGRYAIDPAIVMCESGGDYNAVNGSSGARGAYQIMPGTHGAICPDLGWSPPDQDACASRIMVVQGRGAWSC
jgi:soluble lytic murein transglycosylase-like protein